MNDLLGRLLLLISGALLVPDLLLLLGFSLFSLANLGGFITEAVERSRHRPAFEKLVRVVRRDLSVSLDIKNIPAQFGLPRVAFCELQTSQHASEKILDDLQLRTDRLLGRLNLGIRLGPVLGLAGTLIPLGPALKALAAGDTKTLAEGLIIAFATPVVGMFVGGLCFFMHSVRQQWYTQDINDLEFLFKQITRENSTSKENESCENSVA